jgi:hypothetical protein
MTAIMSAWIEACVRYVQTNHFEYRRTQSRQDGSAMQVSLPHRAMPALWPGSTMVRIAGGLAVLLLAVAPVLAAEPGPAARAAQCGSVVVVRCDRAAGEGQDLGAEAGQLAGARTASGQPNEIVISGRRFRKETPREIFERNLGKGSRPPTMLTRNTADGMHCTTLGATGHRFCSIPGNIRPSAPGLDDHSNDWTF